MSAPALTVPLLRDREARDGHATAYVCERFTCKLPVTDAAALVSSSDMSGASELSWSAC